MRRSTAWFVHGSVLAVGATGVVYGWMRWLCEPADELALVNHPWQPELEAWHILVAPACVFAVGLLWPSHVWARIRGGHRARRRSGIALASLLVPMIVSGYALQTSVDPGARTLWVWVHGGSSIAWLLIYAWHQFAPRGRGERSADR